MAEAMDDLIFEAQNYREKAKRAVTETTRQYNLKIANWLEELYERRIAANCLEEA
jgi:hypothetical protein